VTDHNIENSIPAWLDLLIQLKEHYPILSYIVFPERTKELLLSMNSMQVSNVEKLKESNKKNDASNNLQKASSSNEAFDLKRNRLKSKHLKSTHTWIYLCSSCNNRADHKATGFTWKKFSSICQLQINSVDSCCKKK
jgi:uncharacterized protein YlaI